MLPQVICMRRNGQVRYKFVLILAVLSWVVLTTLWLITLSTNDCPVARKQRGGDVYNSTISDYTTSIMPQETTEQRRDEILLDRITQHYSSWVHSAKDSLHENCTLVMLTYKREKTLPEVLMHYCEVLQLQRILVIWNDISTAIPENITDLTNSCRAELKFLLAEENKLTNRYLPREEIETDCVCLMDDDRIIASEDMKFGFDVWKTFRHRIVGFEERSFIQNSKGKYIYTNYERRRFFKVKSSRQIKKSQLPGGYTIEIRNGTRLLHIKNKTYILGKASANSKDSVSTIVRMPDYNTSNTSNTSNMSTDAPQKSEGYNIMLNSCFIHRAYLDMYFDPLMVPSNLLEYVDKQKNCEDILMSIVVTKFLKDIGRPQCGVLAVKAGWIRNLEDEAYERGGREGLSAREGHYVGRSTCLQKFAEVYGYIPLHTSKIIMSKVTYHP